MKKIYQILTITALALSWNGCSEPGNGDDDKNTAPSLVYFTNGGIHPLTIYDSGEATFSLKVGIYKSSGTEKTATLTVGVLSETTLDDYNEANGTDYSLLPPTCYTIDNLQFAFAKGETNKELSVTLKLAEIKALMETAAAEYVLPLAITEASVGINARYDSYIMIPEVVSPSLGFRNGGFTVFDNETGNTVWFDIDLSIESQWDIDVVVEADANLVTAYNEANGTAYAAFPAEGYTLPAEPLRIASGSSSVKLAVTIDKDKAPAGTYLLPLKISQVSKFTVNELSSAVLLEITYTIDKSAWAIWDFSSEQPSTPGTFAGNGPAVMLIDGDYNSYWHSGLLTDGQAGKEVYVTIDMGSEVTVSRIDLSPCLNFGASIVNAGHFSISDNGTDFTQIGEFSGQTNPDNPGNAPYLYKEMAFTFEPASGRYLKMTITNSWATGMAGGNWNAMGELTAFQ